MMLAKMFVALGEAKDETSCEPRRAARVRQADRVPGAQPETRFTISPDPESNGY